MSNIYRQRLHEACLKDFKHLTPAKTGNISLRGNNSGFLITPSGVPYDEITEDDLVYVKDGKWDLGQKPSSEWQFHADIYAKKKDVNAIVHTHSEYATAVSCLADTEYLPPFHYMIVLFGGFLVPIAEYETFGTKALSESILNALGSTYTGCLISNHGTVTTGSTLQEAILRSRELESLCKTYLMARQTKSKIKELSMHELIAAAQQFKDCGI